MPPAGPGRRATALALAALVLGSWALRAGLAAASGTGLYVDEAQYAWWSLQPAWGYYSKPPGIAWLMATSRALFGDGTAGVRALGQGLVAATALPLYALARDLARLGGGATSQAALAAQRGGKAAEAAEVAKGASSAAGTTGASGAKGSTGATGTTLAHGVQPEQKVQPAPIDGRHRTAGLWAAALLAASPLAGLLGAVSTTDALLLAAWAVALWCALRLLVWGQPLAAVGLSMALGIGLLSKYTMAALLPGLAVLAWRLGDRRCRVWLGLAVAAGGAALLPHLAWNAAAGWPTLQHTLASTDAASAGTGAGAALLRQALFWSGQALVAGPVAVALALVLARRARRRLAPANAAWAPAHHDRSGLAVAPSHGARAGLAAAGPASPGLWLLAASVPLVLAAAVQGWRGRLELNWIAPAHLMAFAVLGVAWTARARPVSPVAPAADTADLAPSPRPTAPRRPAIALALQAALVSGLMALPPLWAAVDGPDLPPRGLDLWARMRAWQPALARLEGLAAHHRGAVLLGEDRTALMHAAWAWRRQGLTTAAFNPDGQVLQHAALACPWARAVALGRPFLVLTEGPPSDRLRGAFGQWRPLGQVQWPQARGQVLDLQLALATAPRGTAAPAAPPARPPKRPPHTAGRC